jgi:hypothetical protein
VSTSDALMVTRKHARVGFRNPPDALVPARALRYVRETLTYEPEDFASPCR